MNLRCQGCTYLHYHIDPVKLFSAKFQIFQLRSLNDLYTLLPVSFTHWKPSLTQWCAVIQKGFLGFALAENLNFPTLWGKKVWSWGALFKFPGYSSLWFWVCSNCQGGKFPPTTHFLFIIHYSLQETLSKLRTKKFAY